MLNKEPIMIFSYGSNLLIERIRRRINSVEYMGRCSLPGYQLLFNKMGADGSAKANLHQTGSPDDSVWGVVHRMHHSDKLKLDRIESGYECVPVETSSGILHSYVASSRLINGDPFCWYMGLIIAGARENNFPGNYIDGLQLTKTIRDLDKPRRTMHEQMIRVAR